MNIEQNLQTAIKRAIATIYNSEINESQITLQKTKRDFN